MEDKFKYQRIFLIFSQEDAGFGNGQTPSGYVKIEVKEGKGKLLTSVQNLREEYSRWSYKLYILKCDEKQLVSVYVGSIPLQGKRGDFQWEFNPDNVGQTGIPIGDFNIAAVLAEGKNESIGEVECPLVAYKDKKFEWKNRLKDTIYNLKPDENKDNEKYSEQPEQVVDEHPEKSLDTDIEGEEDEIPALRQEAENDRPIGNTSEIQCKECNPYAVINNNEGYNRCAECIASINKKDDNTMEANSSNVEKLKYSLDKYFEESDPFGSKRKDYKWWKVSNPVYLNNILYQCNINAPLLFNPKVLMAHFKYRYLIIGIYNDWMKKREYIVCGIPGEYNLDDKPFGDMCRWVQLEGNKPTYGAFGYWLVYFDANTGKLLTLR